MPTMKAVLSLIFNGRWMDDLLPYDEWLLTSKIWNPPLRWCQVNEPLENSCLVCKTFPTLMIHGSSFKNFGGETHCMFNKERRRGGGGPRSSDLTFMMVNPYHQVVANSFMATQSLTRNQIFSMGQDHSKMHWTLIGQNYSIMSF